jgi:hypothetical protein
LRRLQSVSLTVHKAFRLTLDRNSKRKSGWSNALRVRTNGNRGEHIAASQIPAVDRYLNRLVPAWLGEEKTNCYPFWPMSVRTCSVTLTDPHGVRHSVDVTAETLFEAAAMANGWTDPIGLAARLDVEVREPPVTHTVTVLQIQRWLHGATISPNERVRKDKLKALLK